MLYGNYCYIFIENFPQKFSPCGLCYIVELVQLLRPSIDGLNSCTNSIELHTFRRIGCGEQAECKEGSLR